MDHETVNKCVRSLYSAMTTREYTNNDNCISHAMYDVFFLILVSYRGVGKVP